MGMVLGRISVLDIFCEVGQGRRELSGLGMKSGVIWTWMVILPVGGAADVVNGTIGVRGISKAPSPSRLARLMCVVHCLSFEEKHREHLSKFEKRKLYDMDSQ